MDHTALPALHRLCPRSCCLPAVWLLNLLACAWIWLATVEGKENSYLVSAGDHKQHAFGSPSPVVSNKSIMQDSGHKLQKAEASCAQAWVLLDSCHQVCSHCRLLSGAGNGTDLSDKDPLRQWVGTLYYVVMQVSSSNIMPVSCHCKQCFCKQH